MLLSAVLLIGLGLASNAHGLAVPRAVDSPNTTATSVPLFEFSPPKIAECPPDASVLPINKDEDVYRAEAEWLEGRQKVVAEAWKVYVEKLGEDVSEYPDAPRVAIAVSGGGYRSMLNAAGVIKAMDSRTSESLAGGILDITTYTAGLSGGAWLLGSMYYHGFPNVEEWIGKIDLADHLLAPGYTDGATALQENYKILKDYVAAKADAGFPTSMTDYWAGMSAYALLNWTDTALNFRLTELGDTPAVKDFVAPLPIFMSLEVKADEPSLLNNSHPFEWGVFGSGSYASSMGGMLDTSLIGTELGQGKPVNESACADGLATLQYVLGTSTSAFLVSMSSINSTADVPVAKNETDSETKPSARGLTDIFNSLPGTVAGELVSGITELGVPLPQLLSLLGTIMPLMKTPSAETGYRTFEPAPVPNPFKDFNNGTSDIDSEESIYLGDGGLSHLAIPLLPFYVPARKVDVVFAIDGLAGRVPIYNGEPGYITAGHDIANQAEYMKQQGWAFPEVPTKEQFAECDFALVKRIAFFGCNETDIPAIVYMPNRLMLDVNTAFATFKLQYSQENITNIVENGYQQLADETTNKCIACLLFSRSNPELPASEECRKCLTDYCWSNATPLLPTDCPTSAPL